jgi:hypothetical protein
MPGPSEIEIRPFAEMSDFGEDFNAEQSKRLREKSGK